MNEVQKIEALPDEPIFVGEEGNPASMDAANELNLSLDCAEGEAHGVYAEVVEVTPEMAKILLEHNPANRSLSALQVLVISGDISAGNFALNGETIVIADDGNIIDGQFRLSAIVHAGVPVVTVMVFGPSYDVRLTADQGKARSVADYLKMDGHDHYKEQGAAVSLLAGYRASGSFRQPNGSKRLSKTAYFQYAKDHPEIQWAAELVQHHDPATCFIPKSVLIAVTAVLSGVDKVGAAYFIERFIDQLGLVKGEPIHVLHRGLASRRRNKMQLRPWDQAELLVKAWNAHRRGKQFKNFHVSGNTPKPV